MLGVKPMLLPLGALLGLLVATAVSGEQLLFTPPRAVVQLTIEIEKGEGNTGLCRPRTPRGRPARRCALFPDERDAPAPAFTESGVFGIVTECGAGQPPLITLLSASRGLLRRLIPGLDLGPDRLLSFTPHAGALDKSPRVAEIRHLEMARASGSLNFSSCVEHRADLPLLFNGSALS
jgi:hypothetical protein